MDNRLNLGGWRAGPSNGSVYTASEYEPSELDPQDEAWDDWESDEEGDAESQCLFCSQIFSSPVGTFGHCKDTHGFDFLDVKRSLKLDFYQTIRMINYIRHQVLTHPDLATTKSFTITGSEPFLENDEFLKPVLENDALLFAFEELEIADDMEEPVREQMINAKQIDLSNVQPATDLERQLLQLLQQNQTQVKILEEQFNDYKAMVKRTFFDNIADDTPMGPSDEPKGLVDEGNYYFNSYASNGWYMFQVNGDIQLEFLLDIHEQMLKDKARTEAYRDFVYENKDVFKDKIVLDVGCGTGILSMFAAKAGAKQVFSVDNSAIIEKAKLNVKENGLDKIITLVRGKVEEIQLPVPQVDIIISEWMGYFLLFEAMLDSVLVARDRWLAPDGISMFNAIVKFFIYLNFYIVAPSHTRILMAALDDEDLKNDRINFWNDVYGFKMSAMKEPVMNEALVDFIKPNSVITDIVTLKDLYLQEITVKKLDFVTRFALEAKRDGTIHAFGGWFDTWFTRDGHPIPERQEAQHVSGETYLTTSPFGEDTHWKQTSFVLDNPIPVKQGTRITGIFTCHKGRDNPRELDNPELIYFGYHSDVFQSLMLLLGHNDSAYDKSAEGRLRKFKKRYQEYSKTVVPFVHLMTSYGTLNAEPSALEDQQCPTIPAWRERLGQFLENKKLHIAILGLTLIDTACAMIQILYTFFHECENTAPILDIYGRASHGWFIAFETAEVVAVVITSLFLLELVLCLIAFGPKYWLPGWEHWKLHIFDLIVVGTTFSLEVLLRGKEREVVGLLIILRLWRVVKIIDAVAMGMSYQNEQAHLHLEEELAKTRAAYSALEKEFNKEHRLRVELQERLESQ
ncbi:hypothetical protein EC973_003574 [Apophysomyces ossiformis]|uniref:type I protein arginine methyltransferase n=1 Tax=Apophysomyces ossiformis TaxID=679940 RepID=A0A8H7BXW6_9FUNG|nr:hypothetical protein EC973_003574 [Apophysomyces ossiformis]